MGTGIEALRSTELESKLIAIRRQLHQYPEVAYEEFETTRAIREWLEEADIRIIDLPLQTGVVAEIGVNNSGPIIALRADMDALPIQEETGLPYASKIPGKMHACGHDFHTAVILGAAYLLKQQEKTLAGTVRLLFQPAEEKGTGARQLVERGALEGVQAIFGLHNKPDLEVGTIGIKPGPLMASVDGFEIDVEGIGTHAAIPHAGVDPIVAASQIVTALQSIVSRNVSPLDNAVVSVTTIHGGTTWNVIPDKVVLGGTIRTFQEEVRARIPDRLRAIIEGVASAYGAKVHLRWIAGPPPVHNDEKLTKLSIDVAKKVGLQVVTPNPSTAGEDFAYYQLKIPGSFVFFGTSGTEVWHHPGFTLDERALLPGAHYFAELAASALKDR
ncbi:M20 peptidase aminoacylase family protein [Brevibacillus porteri]|uniref:Amidohydrolase n=1 Tax=Brevibacillus porteri TaxID=2126350 RepID=A0ABX5FTJ3_9BACL|nr:M20 peptidase aminoacylase family protein [Brevibacillus porteri]MED1799273.1 M20 peptidase aminoacylase family protein [Brevibacillus porteri]MED2132339.1 M20 peptidase aminoacylase family protein [Brevibacillus porteri]MED2744423.1 M20 peptidase aminoacylase family protein [Brevibacillus porteri]MED2814867.1 M20 peptidase aminoacylase family protein [Brevibacillus porteri]MED2895688.1 M20 peptidase aminoacylase family protein [Brevibacillus porteri]